MKTACTQTITILYKYFYIWGLDLRLNYYWTSELLLNLWEYIQGLDTTNKWVVYFVIVLLF